MLGEFNSLDRIKAGNLFQKLAKSTKVERMRCQLREIMLFRRPCVKVLRMNNTLLASKY